MYTCEHGQGKQNEHCAGLGRDVDVWPHSPRPVSVALAEEAELFLNASRDTGQAVLGATQPVQLHGNLRNACLHWSPAVSSPLALPLQQGPLSPSLHASPPQPVICCGFCRRAGPGLALHATWSHPQGSGTGLAGRAAVFLTGERGCCEAEAQTWHEAMPTAFCHSGRSGRPDQGPGATVSPPPQASVRPARIGTEVCLTQTQLCAVCRAASYWALSGPHGFLPDLKAVWRHRRSAEAGVRLSR